MSAKNLPIAISISPMLDAMELVQFNEKSGEIEQAVSLPCSFDTITRQMVDRDQIAQALRDLYSIGRLPMSTPAVLVLPGFFTREIEMPAEFSREELQFALVSEAERFYIFKKTEPVVDWVKLDDNRLLYSAFPKVEIEKYVHTFQELRIPLLAIELGSFSLMRGLLATGVLGNDSIVRNESWCLVIISDNAMCASIQQGLKIQKTTDVPLSDATSGDEAAVSDIQQDFQLFVADELSSTLGS